MSRLAPTRAASATQSRGAAAHLISDFSRPPLHLHRPHDIFFFICTRTPARWRADIDWRPNRWLDHGPGGTVLRFRTGQGGRTGNPLETCGSAVLFYRPSRDVCGGRGARACRGNPQNHRTIEPLTKNGRNQPFLEGGAVLSRFCGSEPNKIGGGYSTWRRAASSRADQHLIAGGARQNFRGSRRAIGADRDRAQLAGSIVESGGFPPFSEGRSGHVGMVMSEWSRETVSIQPVSWPMRKLSRLTADRAWRRAEDPRVVDRPGRGVAPPARADQIGSMSALQALGIIFDARSSRQSDPGESLKGANGSGCGCLLAVGDQAAGFAVQCNHGERVGDRGVSSADRETDGKLATLWAGVHHVNG